MVHSSFSHCYRNKAVWMNALSHVCFMFLRQLPDCILFSLGEGIARHLIGAQFMGASRPGRDILVSCLNLCSLLTTNKSNRPGHITPTWCKHFYMVTERCAAVWWQHFSGRVWSSSFSTPALRIMMLWLPLPVVLASAWSNCMMKQMERNNPQKMAGFTPS